MSGGNIHFTFGAASSAGRQNEMLDEPALAAAFAPGGEEQLLSPPPSLEDRGVGDPSDHPADPDESHAAARRREWLAPSALAAMVLAWTAWFGLTHAAGFATLDPNLVSGLVGLWSCPVMLIAVGWLIVQRSSRREAYRFADAARALSRESERLETRLTTVNRELSLAREFIASQARDLDTAGRIASERLSEHAARLQSLVQENSGRVEAISTVSAAALENMERLRGQLPVMTSAAKDVTNHIGNAGRAAHVHVQELIGGFNRLNEFGLASERQVASLRARIDEALDSYGERVATLDTDARARVDMITQATEDLHRRLVDHQNRTSALIEERASALAAEIAGAREAIDGAEAESLTSLRARFAALRDEAGAMGRSLRDGEAAALGGWRAALAELESEWDSVRRRLADAERTTMEAARLHLAALAEDSAGLDSRLADHATRFDAEAARRRARLEEDEAAAMARLAALAAEIDVEWQRRHESQQAEFAALAASGNDLGQHLQSVEQRVGAIAASAQETESALAARLDRLLQRVEDARTTLAVTETAIDRLTDNSVRLLELIQAGARHSDEDLGTAIGKGEARLAELSARAMALQATVGEARRHGEDLSAYVLQSHEQLGETGKALAALHDDLDARARNHGQALGGIGETLANLNGALAALDEQAGQAASRAQGELAAALVTLQQAIGDAVAAIEEQGSTAVHTVATRLGSEAGAAIEQTIRVHMAEVGGRLEQAAAHASGISREATVQLRDQLLKVDELVGNLEARVGQARARAEEQVDNDFARRAALITDSLNSNAIDIAKALDTDVSDQSWAAYLRGDRGIFTRRAVRLLDSGDAKSIAQLYEGERDFREHVAQYIHDFEAMLRQLLSTRDGHSLGVTLLSSDMGKLYVALAQAIERLRN